MDPIPKKMLKISFMQQKETIFARFLKQKEENPIAKKGKKGKPYLWD